MNYIWNQSFIFGHKQLLALYFLSKLILDSFRSILVKNEISQHLFVLIILLLIKLKQIFFPFQIFFNLLDFFLQRFLCNFFHLHLICSNLQRYQQFSRNSIPLLLQKSNSGQVCLLLLLMHRSQWIQLVLSLPCSQLFQVFLIQRLDLLQLFYLIDLIPSFSFQILDL